MNSKYLTFPILVEEWEKLKDYRVSLEGAGNSEDRFDSDKSARKLV